MIIQSVAIRIDSMEAITIFNRVKLHPDSWTNLQSAYPEIRVLNPSGSDVGLDGWDNAEVAFGNCSVEDLLRAKRLRWVQLVSAGIDGYQALGNRDIIVTTARGCHWKPIAEYLIFAMLYFTRRYPLFRRKQSERIWYRDPEALELLRNQRVLIIGYGGIARALIGYLQAFGPKITCLTRRPPVLQPADADVQGMDTLSINLAKADHVILALPLTLETEELMDKAELAHMKRGAFFYNVSRGRLVDEKALTDMLRSGEIGGAALDVFNIEPLPPQSPLWELENVMITPHLAGHYHGLRQATFELFSENLIRFQSGMPLKNIADFNQGY